MGYWTDKFTIKAPIKRRENGVVTLGALEPVMTVLDLNGFELSDIYLIGINDNCGSVFVETQSRANEIKGALEPAYRVEVKQVGKDGVFYWEAKYDRRLPDGDVRHWMLTYVKLKDDRVIFKDGKWTGEIWENPIPGDRDA